MLLLLLACVQDTPDDPTETDLPTEYVLDEEEAPEPALTEAEVELAIQEALELALSLNAQPVMDAYQSVMDHAESTCPDYYESEGNVYWYDTCTTSDGTDFSGYAFYQLYEDYESGGALYNGEAFYGVAEVQTADGRTFLGGGGASVLVAEAEEYTAYSSSIYGSFADSESTGDDWLAAGLSPDLDLWSADYWAYGVHYAAVDGGVTGLSGGVSTVVFAEVALADGWYSCTDELTGSVLVRDEDGGWYDVLFDNSYEEGAEVDPSECDGCGTIWFSGEPVGSACVDASALVDWETPW